MLITINDLGMIQQSLPLEVHLLGHYFLQKPIKRIEGISFYQWFLCRKGTGEIVIEGKKHSVCEGEGFLIYPGISHTYKGITNDWTLDIVGFSGQICTELLNSLGMTKSGAYHFFDFKIFSTYIYDMITCYKEKSDFQIDLSSLCYKLLLHLSNAVKPISGINFTDKHSIVTTIIKFIEENYHLPINLDDIAEHCDFTKEHLCVLFKKNMNQTINSFLTDIRINHSRVELLQYPDKKIHEISISCGFQDTSYFCRVFKKYHNKSPEQFRKDKF